MLPVHIQNTRATFSAFDLTVRVRFGCQLWLSGNAQRTRLGLSNDFGHYGVEKLRPEGRVPHI